MSLSPHLLFPLIAAGSSAFMVYTLTAWLFSRRLSVSRALQGFGHPGSCTLNAEGAEAAVHRMSVFLFADAQVPMGAARKIFAQAVNLVVQVGWMEGRR